MWVGGFINSLLLNIALSDNQKLISKKSKNYGLFLDIVSRGDFSLFVMCYRCGWREHNTVLLRGTARLLPRPKYGRAIGQLDCS